MCKYKQIWLEKEGAVADVELDDVATDVDGTTTVRIKSVDYMRLEYPSDSLEAKALMETLSGDEQRGKRFLIYKTDDPTKPLIVVEKGTDRNNKSENEN